MRPARKRTLFWQGVGWLCYLGGLGLCLFTAVGVYLAEPSGSFQNVTTVDVVVLVWGIAMIVGGRLVTAKAGPSTEMVVTPFGGIGDRHPEQSRLEELGYHIPPEGNDEPQSGFAYEDGEVMVVCEECGEPNESDFDFCRTCSTRLPE